MAQNPNPDRNKEYMKENWGTDMLITDYGSMERVKKLDFYEEKRKFIQEVMEYEDPSHQHHLKEQAEMHKKIRNDDDYDDWEYGTEPTYGIGL